MSTLDEISMCSKEEESAELRRGPWTHEEDTLLAKFIACHGQGRWNMVAKNSGLRRTGKSCRMRWLNYLNPDIKRGDLSPQEQLLILELHSRWGNRWSKIAECLPGRTDNEIKNYWRTRVLKQARLLKVDPANGIVFQDIVRCIWIPRLIKKIEASSFSSAYAMGSSTAYSQNTSSPIRPLGYVSYQQERSSLTIAAVPSPRGLSQRSQKNLGDYETFHSADHLGKNSISQSYNRSSRSSTSCTLSTSISHDNNRISDFGISTTFPIADNNSSCCNSVLDHCYDHVDNNSNEMEAFSLNYISPMSDNQLSIDDWMDNNLVGNLYVDNNSNEMEAFSLNYISPMSDNQLSIDDWMDNNLVGNLWNLDELR